MNDWQAIRKHYATFHDEIMSERRNEWARAQRGAR